jgi:hypothetical protein
MRICRLQRDAKSLFTQDIHVISVDEKTGMQALERDGKTLPMKAGTVERIEYNYIRHGTQVLTANLHLGTGQNICPTIADTRTEQDFVKHVQRLVETTTNPQSAWIILCDQLNTHKSEALVRYVAQACNDNQDLGEKGETGILKDMISRMRYLEDTSHRIHFVYTPKHCSWLNSIEVWFSILTTHVLKRGNFTSINDLKQKIQRYIDYYNAQLAKAWKWSVVKNKEIQLLINKVKQAEGILAC